MFLKQTTALAFSNCQHITQIKLKLYKPYIKII